MTDVRRRTRAVVAAGAALVLLAIFFVGFAPAASAGPPASCPHGQVMGSNGVCVVIIGHGGYPGYHGSTGTYPRHCELMGKTIPCHVGSLWWYADQMCYISIASPQPPKSDSTWQGNSGGAIYTCWIPESPLFQVIRLLFALLGIPIPLIYDFWAPTAPVGADPTLLAEKALSLMHVPHPSTGRYPAGKLHDGRSYTVVKAHTWYWTTPASYRPHSTTAAAPDMSATVTITPTRLTFRPGDGSGLVSCAGPGTAWRQSYGPWAASPSGCEYTYQHAADAVTATYGIEWSVSWTTSVGVTGTLPDFVSATQATFAVAEMQTVVAR